MKITKGSWNAFLKRQWREWRFILGFLVFFLVPLKSSLADWNWVPTGSMNPNILEGDLVYVNKLAYDLRFPLTRFRLHQWDDPARGDVVVLFSPADGTRLVKRVVGIPGDQISIRDGRLAINGKRVAIFPAAPEAVAGLEEAMRRHARAFEEQLPGHTHTILQLPGFAAQPGVGTEIRLGPEEYFVMGDNRDNSLDSRRFGPVHRSRIIGEVTSVIASFNIFNRGMPRGERFFTGIE